MYLGPLSFFRDESGERFVNVVYLFKELAFSFIDLFYLICLASVLLTSTLTFIISFPLLALGFVLFLFNSYIVFQHTNSVLIHSLNNSLGVLLMDI